MIFTKLFLRLAISIPLGGAVGWYLGSILPLYVSMPISLLAGFGIGFAVSEIIGIFDGGL